MIYDHDFIKEEREKLKFFITKRNEKLLHPNLFSKKIYQYEKKTNIPLFKSKKNFPQLNKIFPHCNNNNLKRRPKLLIAKKFDLSNKKNRERDKKIKKNYKKSDRILQEKKSITSLEESTKAIKLENISYESMIIIINQDLKKQEKICEAKDDILTKYYEQKVILKLMIIYLFLGKRF